MGSINGGNFGEHGTPDKIFGLSTVEINEMFDYDRYTKRLLLNHRAKHYHYLVDRLQMINPELREVLEFIKVNVSVSWYKAVRGRLVGFILIMYMDFHLHKIRYLNRGNLIYFSNAFYIQQYLQRVVAVLINNYNYPNKYYGFKIQRNKLLQFSIYCYAETYEVVTNKIIPHYHKLYPDK